MSYYLRPWDARPLVAAPIPDQTFVKMVSSMKKWQCMVCEFVYDEALGDPDSGIAPGTRWEDVPDDWCCPVCGVGKEDFEMVQI